MLKPQSKDYTVYIPENGSPLSGLSPLECGDIQTVNDSIGGTISSQSRRSLDTNKPVEIKRIRQFDASELSITVPEEVARDLRKMRDSNCVVGVQRRLFCEGVLDHVHHYGYVSFDDIEVRNATNKGLFGRPSLPQQTTNAVFGLYQYYDRTPPIIHVQEGWNPIEVVFCDDKTCNTCCNFSDGCQIAYGLFDNIEGQRIFRILIANGRSVGSEEITLTTAEVGGINTIHCYQGKLFVGLSGAVNLVITSRDFSPTEAVNTSIGTSGASVTKIANNGNIMYAGWNSDISFGVDFSIDNGNTWNTVFEVAEVASIVDMAAAGSSVAFITSTNRIFVNYENGRDTFVELDAPIGDLDLIAMAVPDFQKKNCPVIYVANKESKIYVRTNIGNWESVLVNELFCKEGSKGSLFLSEDGFGVWYSRAMRRLGNVYTLKNVGKGLDCEWMQFKYQNEFDLDCGREVAVTSCVPLSFPVSAKLVIELTDSIPSGVVSVCFQDTTIEKGYVSAIADGTYILEVFGFGSISCSTRGGVRSLRCDEDSYKYPCLSYHQSAFAMCPDDPNVGLLVVGTSCPPEILEDNLLTKGFTLDGEAETLVSLKAEECLPNICK